MQQTSFVATLATLMFIAESGSAQPERRQHRRSAEARRHAEPMLVGDWQWSDGTRTAMRADGTFIMPNDRAGRWQAHGGRRFRIQWNPGRSVEVWLSEGGDVLRNGRRGRALAIRATEVAASPAARPAQRRRDCGTGPEDEGCNETRNDAVAMETQAFVGLMSSLRATRSDIRKKRMIISASRQNAFTAVQLMAMLDLFRSEMTKMQVVRGVVQRVIDPHRALGYAARLRSSANRERLTNLLSSSSRAQPIVVLVSPTPGPVRTRPARRAPPARCPAMPACGIACDFGQARDDNGCILCACNPSPLSPGER